MVIEKIFEDCPLLNRSYCKSDDGSDTCPFFLLIGILETKCMFEIIKEQSHKWFKDYIRALNNPKLQMMLAISDKKAPEKVKKLKEKWKLKHKGYSFEGS